ncbi:hypothetical protein [Sulfitobacter sp. 915]|uniref:hypothetical protein n=1 Tax=Sulfitobacter sp. 915 TaxID=3368558 RepID=UPI003745BE9E
MIRTILICFLVFAGCAYADSDAVEKYRNYLPEQLLALPEDERSSSVPMMYSSAANLAASPAGDFITQARLNSLMYNGFSEFEGAKRDFQVDLGEEPTGNLTVWQLHTLDYRTSRLNMTFVSFFPFTFNGEIAGNMAFVKGTLTMLDDKIAYPVNHVDIVCDRQEGTCKYRQVALTLPDETSWAQSYHVGEIANETYRITRWDKNQIDAVPMNNTACRTNQLSFNFETKEFFEIARNNTSENCQLFGESNIPRLEKPRISQIVDGWDIISDEFEAIKKEAYSFYSSSFRSQLEALIPK